MSKTIGFRRHAPVVLTLALAGVGADAAAQSIASRVADVGTGTVWMSYAARPGVCGNGRGSISIRDTDGGRSQYNIGSRRSREWEDECEPGPVRVSLDVRRGDVTEVRAYVGGRWRGEADLDLGTVSAKDASDYLMEVAASARGDAAEDAIFPAMIAEGVTLWPRLLTLAKDTGRPDDVRKSAVFWVSQAAGDAATRGLEEIVGDPTGDREVRKSAVFSLSQRPRDEAVPALIRVAKTNPDPDIRRSAIFWLGQADDDRAVRFFEEILLGDARP